MQTKKDAEIVGWIGRIGAAGAEQVRRMPWPKPADAMPARAHHADLRPAAVTAAWNVP